jgi:hypothetical protein
MLALAYNATKSTIVSFFTSYRGDFSVTILIATSVIRGASAGQSHGAVHLVDMHGGRVAHVVDWKAPGFDLGSPGGGRGLRGVAFDGERVFIAASGTLFAFTPAFELLDSYHSPFLDHCHEIFSFEGRLYLTSTAFDSILGFDLKANRFDWGLHVTESGSGFQGAPFDPQSTQGPSRGNALGLNSLWCDSRGMFISGSRSSGLLFFDAQRIDRLVTLPYGVQNARPWRDGVLFNDTAANVARFMTPTSNQVFKVPFYPDAELNNDDEPEEKRSRQGFARGLCVLDNSVFAVGSSPATITLHNLDTMKTTHSINFNGDPRHTIQSLAVWPYPHAD